MSLSRWMVRAAARWTDDARARVVLRGARVGRNVRVFGIPSVVCEGTLAVGDDVVLVSTPAPVTIVVERGASVEIGAGACIESGVTLHARRRIVIAAGARVERGAVLDDLASDAPEIVVARPTSSSREVRSTGSGRVRAIVASIVPAVRELGPADDVRRAQGWDSLAALRVIVTLEEELGVLLAHDLFARAYTLEAIERAARGEAPP